MESNHRPDRLIILMLTIIIKRKTDSVRIDMCTLSEKTLNNYPETC